VVKHPHLTILKVSQNYSWQRSPTSSKPHTHTHLFIGTLSRTTQVSRYQKGKINLDFTKQETVSGSGISWAICKSATISKQTTTPAPHHSVFTGRMPFLLPNQQHQSTEGKPVNQLNKNDFQIKKTIRLLSFSRSRWQAGWECLCMHVSYAQMGRQPENIMPLAHLLHGQRH